MPLIKDGRIVADDWVPVPDGAPLATDAPVIVSLARWRAEREALLAEDRPLGVRLAGDTPVDEIVGDLPRLSLIAVEFPAITDGRGYTLGRLLRERYGFEGELRAVGDLVRDVYPFLHRCGFDAVEARNEEDARAWEESLAAVSVAYQPAADRRATVFALRHSRAHEAAANRPASYSAERPRPGSRPICTSTLPSCQRTSFSSSKFRRTLSAKVASAASNSSGA